MATRKRCLSTECHQNGFVDEPTDKHLSQRLRAMDTVEADCVARSLVELPDTKSSPSGDQADDELEGFKECRTAVLEMRTFCHELLERMQEQQAMMMAQQRLLQSQQQQQQLMISELTNARAQQGQLLEAIKMQGMQLTVMSGSSLRQTDMHTTMDCLPDPVLVTIFSRLGVFDDVARCACVCRRWREQLKEITKVLRTLSPYINGQDPRSLSLTFDHLDCEHPPRLLFRRLTQLHQVSFSHTTLTRLHIRNPDHPSPLSPSLLPSPPDCLVSLQDLSLWCSTLTPDTTRFLLHLPSLRSLALRADCSAALPGLLEALAALPGLEELQLVDEVFEEMSEEGVMAVMDHVARLTALKRLDLSDASGHLPAAALRRNIASLSSLLELDLSFVAATDWPPLEEALSSIPLLTTLRRLNISHNDLAIDDLLASLSALTNLQHLATNCNTPAGITHIARISSLQALTLSCDHTFTITEGSFAPLSSLPSLRKLAFPGIGSRVDDILREVVPLTQVRALELERAELGQAAKLFIGQMTHLRELNLHLSNLFEQPLRHFTDLTRLSSLNLACTRVKDLDLDDIKWLVALRAVDLRSCMKLTECCLQFLQALPRLQCLKLSKRQEFSQEAVRALGATVQLCDSSSSFKWNDFEGSDTEEDDQDEDDDAF